MEEMREEREFRKELSKSIQESNILFACSLKTLTSSMADLASSMQKSIELTSQSYSSQQQHQFYSQNFVQHGNYINHQDMRSHSPFIANRNQEEENENSYYEL